jgi:hypothetical protein
VRELNKIFMPMNNVAVPFSYLKNILFIVSLLKENSQDICTYTGLIDSINELNNNVSKLRASIKELIVATPNNLFTDNEDGTVKEQVDAASNQFFDDLSLCEANLSRLVTLKDFIDYTAESSGWSYDEVFNFLLRDNNINYRYFNGKYVYDIKTMDLLDRNVDDIINRALDNVDHVNLNYTGALSDSVSGKFYVEIFDKNTNRYNLFINNDGVVYYDSKKDAVAALKINGFDVFSSNYISASYIKSHPEMFIGTDNKSFMAVMDENEKVFTENFIRLLYPEQDVRFSGIREDDNKSTLFDLICIIKKRLVDVIGAIKDADNSYLNKLINEHVEKTLGLRKVKVEDIKVVDLNGRDDIINKIYELNDYEFLNNFVESALEIVIGGLYRVVEV